MSDLFADKKADQQPIPQNTDSVNTPPPAEDSQAPTNLFADQLSMITNERGEQKYSNVEDALKALAHSQQHIRTLETERQTKDAELAAVKEKLDKLGDIDQLVERLQPQQTPPAEPAAQPAAGLTEEKVLELLQAQQQQSQAEQVAAANVQQVHEALVSSYGEKAQEIVVAKAQELNMSPVDLGKLSEQNPALVLSLFGKQQAPIVQPTQSNLNIPPINPSEDKLGKPEKSLLAGATSKEQTEFMRKIREEVYRENGVEV